VGARAEAQFRPVFVFVKHTDQVEETRFRSVDIAAEFRDFGTELLAG
jgi:hypothetical protein